MMTMWRASRRVMLSISAARGGGLSGAAGAADKNESSRNMSQQFDGRRKVESAEGRNSAWQDADSGGSAALFAMKIDAETAQALDAVGGGRDEVLAVKALGMR